ncbi:tumor protein D54-like isoform X1 [Limulus polyphemus]|uniref:Tumor protein D54-like isoform X1 n=1 Tax=Limulus polyphemus TaxID=6850 RepID=A0ABM1B7Q5_LIMPO|nr:tumor protein D54-like isoform X1 [Limulus polyphemus]
MEISPGEEKQMAYPDLSEEFYDTSKEIKGDATTPDSGIHDFSNMDPNQRTLLEQDLAKTEEEITTLRHVLAAKIRKAQELKQMLGISVWKEFKDDIGQNIKNIQETPVYKGISSKLSEWNTAITRAPIYQRTSHTLKAAGEKSTIALGNFGASMTKKLGEVKNSQTFRSFEEKVGTAYENVKSKLSNSRSSSTHSFIETARSSGTTPVTSPVIPEEKPLL